MMPGNSKAGDEGNNKGGKRPLDSKEEGSGGDEKVRFAVKYKRIVRKPPGVVLYGHPVVRGEPVTEKQEDVNVPGDDSGSVGNARLGGRLVVEDLRGHGVVHYAPLEGKTGGWETGKVVSGDSIGSGGDEWDPWPDMKKEGDGKEED